MKLGIKKMASVLLVILGFVLPVVMAVGYSHTIKSHPLENTVVQDAVFLSDSNNLVEVAFFGYVGCASICPASLLKLADVLQAIEEKYPGLHAGAVFVDISPEEDRIPAAEYARYFSGKIRGVNLTDINREAVKSDFAIRTNRSARQPQEIFHTDHFYVLSREKSNWRIARVLANDTDRETLEKEITEALVRGISDEVLTKRNSK